MRYVDVILPLPLEGLFTYALPDGMTAVEGVRVVVPLGKSKTYIALVARIHDEKPDFDVRPISEVLDRDPVVLPSQLRFWRWMAFYYLSPLGEVYNAALPQGLKVRGVYKARTETFVRLSDQFRTERMLHIAMDMMSRSARQQKVLAEYLTLSGIDEWDGQGQMPELCEVSRDELLNATHATTATIRQLVEKKILTTYEKEVGRLNHDCQPNPANIKPLSPPQTEAYNQILMQFMRKRVVLLHGVTSSGKTEIYIHLIQRATDRGEQVLYLLPEIALTVQMRERLLRVFGNRLGIYHSKYADAERVEIWQKQLSPHPYDVILGARSALLLPFQRLGLVIVDEEHENSFKQQDPAPRYHARDAAIMLAHQCNALTLLGTATPSAETFYNAGCGTVPRGEERGAGSENTILSGSEERGAGSENTVLSGSGERGAGSEKSDSSASEKSKYGYVRLAERYQGIELPEVEVVDVREMQRRRMMNGPFSPQLLQAMREALDKEEQVILFQNRRGFAPMIECHVCGWVPRCKNCDVSLTYHKNMNQLTCHYCGYTYRVPDTCPNCENTDLRGRGYGTEKVENLIMDIFPDVKVARMDLDSTRSRQAYERIISDFSAHRTQVLIGTQMVTKGLDFDRVSVVGILSADSMLNYPDFRAYEHAFTMMMQVSGRAGRKGRRGRVLLQTKNPDLPVVQQLVRNDGAAFFADLMEERSVFRYPPFFRLIYVYLKHRDEQVVNTAGIEMGSRLRQWLGARVLGPDKPTVARVKALHIRKLVLKLETTLSPAQVRQCLRLAQEQMLQDKRYSTLQVYYDVDPV